MSKRKSTKARKGVSAKSVATRRRHAREDSHDKLLSELVHAKASVMTCALALQGGGVYDNISVTLRGVDNRLDVMRELLEKGARS